ncbi:MAG TPA: DNA-processing protein DprA [candidate division Zixibacteria bacterium]|nr:DNA-processing protein DprA [candidate division Zixibacteria bacterium]
MAQETAAKIWALTGLSGVSARAFSRLLERYQTLDGIFSADADALREEFELSDELAESIAEADTRLSEAQEFIDSLTDREISVVTVFDEEYPEGLRELHTPPPLLFYRGTLPQRQERIVSLVGSGSPSAEGIEVAVEFAQLMAARGISLVSGLARGIDSAALVGATGAADRANTYAVVSCGLDDIQPEENQTLAAQVAARGAVISEAAPDAPPTAEAILEANRLIVGLSRAVVVGEILLESMGALDVVHSCVESGKILFALVPSERQALDQAALERIVALGAIPVRFPEDFDTIVTCLV